jgi:flagellar P-ring protein FlgI
VRPNQLVGYGLVVGLDGTGDQTSQAPFTVQSIKNMLKRFGVTIPPNVNPQLKNVAAVTVHADLPPFAKPGQTHRRHRRIDRQRQEPARRRAADDAAARRDGEVYAIAQGNLVVSGFGVQGRDGSRIAVNVPSAGRVPNGATVEREVPNDFAIVAARHAEPELRPTSPPPRGSPRASTRCSATGPRKRSMRCRCACRRRST